MVDDGFVQLQPLWNLTIGPLLVMCLIVCQLHRICILHGYMAIVLDWNRAACIQDNEVHPP